MTVLEDLNTFMTNGASVRADVTEKSTPFILTGMLTVMTGGAHMKLLLSPLSLFNISTNILYATMKEELELEHVKNTARQVVSGCASRARTRWPASNGCSAHASGGQPAVAAHASGGELASATTQAADWRRSSPTGSPASRCEGEAAAAAAAAGPSLRAPSEKTREATGGRPRREMETGEPAVPPRVTSGRSYLQDL
ncbi:uncharacterized protein LOC123447033 isoform X3 [Hordeum vulgare subsp. vulgare]|uniref:uncharacterized protein LOC123447033 isoform X3 n=1 Tax=Hordeum vulgare subsp. vulgare TaxID=112509 RepID=UPI001D1A596C|nr:uncharacterized protein LOC123447033 isoform X3 [Hordeum vulgare subsp. vulgare]